MLNASLSPTDGLQPHEAASTFAALGSEQRLSVLRALVRAGGGGLAVGAVAERTGVTGSTLTHHLRLLALAGLVRQSREGRQIMCSVDHDAVRRLSEYLLSECCADAGEHDHG